ncbi:PA2169 family four-helix-bundle protein [Myxococcus xanthus]|uniref:PA2169 family four-helix-bundle protein n=1 Tax=Myxococcus xanthus TaxID=34 RepID=UPI001F19A844|nr:PA2169 family four-helix-bundle protein [Myxococcus xanthus]
MHPSSLAPYGPQELAQDLRRLMELPAQTKAEQSLWYDEAQKVQDRIKASEELLGIPHSLWHFFSEADVRAKEPSIRDAQFKQVRAHVAVLETGAIPPDDSKQGSFGGLFRRLWQAVRGKG